MCLFWTRITKRETPIVSFQITDGVDLVAVGQVRQLMMLMLVVNVMIAA
jgi:hypothetical protein